MTGPFSVFICHDAKKMSQYDRTFSDIISTIKYIFFSFSGKFSTTSLAQGSEKEYAYEMACSNIRYGMGVTQEVGLVRTHYTRYNIY